MRKWTENEEMDRECGNGKRMRKWRVTFCRKNLNIRSMRKWFWIKSGCEEALQVVPACSAPGPHTHFQNIWPSSSVFLWRIWPTFQTAQVGRRARGPFFEMVIILELILTNSLWKFSETWELHSSLMTLLYWPYMQGQIQIWPPKINARPISSSSKPLKTRNFGNPSWWGASRQSRKTESSWF